MNYWKRKDISSDTGKIRSSTNIMKDIIAIIPARGGSKRIPNKNIVPVGGKPMLAHSIEHALQSKKVKEVYVSTDDNGIASVALEYGAKVIKRPAELAGGKASSESALIHVLDERIKQGKKDPDLVVFLQCTSPVRDSGDIDNAISVLLGEKADSLFSACRDLGLFWEENGKLKPVNYDPKARKMEQDRPHQYRENGSIFVMRTKALRKEKNRMAGKVTMYQMDLWRSFQVDDYDDLKLVDWILRQCPPKSFGEVDLVVFDFDGVMTDNTMRVQSNGAESVVCNRADGWGIARMRDAKIPMIVLSTEKHSVVGERCKKLKIPCHQGIDNKAKYLKEYLKEEGFDPKKTVYIGNDVNDLECMKMVGIPIAPADSDPEIRSVAVWVTEHSGGRGAVREVCDRILHSLK